MLVMMMISTVCMLQWKYENIVSNPLDTKKFENTTHLSQS